MAFRIVNYIFILIISLNYAVASNGSQCCPVGQVVIMKTTLCWEPSTNTTRNITLTCPDIFRVRQNMTINTDDSLSISLTHGRKIHITKSRYCIANVVPSFEDVNLTQIKTVAVICRETEDPPIVEDEVLGYCMIVSVIFLSLTAFIYTAFSELRDLQGKSIINFSISLAIGLGILIIMKLMDYSDMNACAARGFLAYFFVMTSFFWANAISIQVLISTRQPSVIADYGWRDFKWYALYSWGCPTILTICMAIVNFHPGDHKKPGIGLNHCWFFTKTEQWYYMYSVMSILIAINICIFIYTSTIIWRHSFSSSHLKALRYKFGMTIRLIILMGLPWIFEMLGSLSEKHIVWAILDVFNTLQGLLIFLLLVVFRRRVVKVMHKHGWLDCISGVVEKYLAVADDDEDNVIQHTDVPMTMNGH